MVATKTIKMDETEVRAYSTANIEDVGFIEAGIEAAIVKLSEKVEGWTHYSVANLDSTHGEELTIYALDLTDGDAGSSVAHAEVMIRGVDIKEVKIAVEKI